jgi:methylmalonyl-CoA mutase N-terminal domain/subunit
MKLMAKPSGTTIVPARKTLSGIPIEAVYTAHDIADLKVPQPGEFPYTRGIHESMYRGKLWTMRQFSGFATAEETNARYHYLLAQGQAGLSVAFDLPTLMGYDSDHPTSEGEVGKCGVAISSLADMETLFHGIPLSDVTVSMTINSPASDPVGHVPGGRRAAGSLLGIASPALCRTTS